MERHYKTRKAGRHCSDDFKGYAIACSAGNDGRSINLKPLRNVKQHITPLFLLAILCFPALLFLYFQLQQRLVQHEMLEKLEHSQLQQITLHNDAVYWYKKNKELIVVAKLFDVHSYSVKNDSTIFRGIFDDKETELKNQVKKLLGERDENDSSRDLMIVKILLQLCISNEVGSVDDPPGLLITDLNEFVQSSSVLSVVISAPFQPPKAESYI